jgi:hypothetical protein
MGDQLIYKDLVDDLFEYFESHSKLLPYGVELDNVNIIGDAYKFPVKGETILENWLVIFRGEAGYPEWREYYELKYEGLQLINIKKVKNPDL